ncbi:MAG TPA: tetratricopeptide repeat protein [Anaerolineales bacterium]|nr:tetratricopeptide repeat protein [Anaerolineales bacterium]
MLDDDSAPARAARHLFQRAYLLQQRGALADAIRLYKESISHYPTAEAHTFLGWVYSMLNRYEEAVEECQKAIAVDPTFGNPYNDIGAYFIELGWWREAIPWLEKAIAAPRYENREFAHMNLGRVHEHFGKWDKARQCYRDALALNPEYQTARHAYRLLLGKAN